MNQRKRRARHNLAATVATMALLVASFAAIASAATDSGGSGGFGGSRDEEIVPIEPLPLGKMPEPQEDHQEAEEKPFYYDIPLSYELQDFTRAQAEEVGVPTELLLAMMEQESGYRHDAVSSTGDYGIMQINKVNHDSLRQALGITDFLDPEQSIRCGAYLIGRLMEKYDGGMHRALTSYNRGEAGASKYYKANGTYRSAHSNAVVEIYNRLQEVTNNVG